MKNKIVTVPKRIRKKLAKTRGPKNPKTPQNKQGAGKKSRLTPAFIEAAVTLCSSLAHDKAVCAALKVHPATWCDWKNKAEAGRQPYQRMFEEIAEARSLKQIQLVSAISSDPDWRAKTWLLERLEPETYSLKHRIEHTGAKGAPLQAAPAAVTVVVQGIVTDNPYEPGAPGETEETDSQ